MARFIHWFLFDSFLVFLSVLFILGTLRRRRYPFCLKSLYPLRLNNAQPGDDRKKELHETLALLCYLQTDGGTHSLAEHTVFQISQPLMPVDLFYESLKPE